MTWEPKNKLDDEDVDVSDDDEKDRDDDKNGKTGLYPQRTVCDTNIQTRIFARLLSQKSLR